MARTGHPRIDSGASDRYPFLCRSECFTLAGWSGTDDEVDFVSLTGDEMNAAEIEDGELVARLFSYIAGVQRLRAQASPTAEELIGAGRGFWLSELPDHDAVLDSRDEAEGPAITLKFRAKEPVPAVTAELEPWLEAPYDRPGWEPKVRSEYLYGETVNEDREEVRLARLSDNPDIAAEIDQWLAEWRSWALEDIHAAPVRKLYRRIEEMMRQLDANPEQYEAVFQVGYLHTPGSDASNKGRHLVRIKASITKNEAGDIEITTSGSPMFHVSPLDAALLPDTTQVAATRSAIENSDGRATSSSSLGPALEEFASYLKLDTTYVADDQLLSTGDVEGSSGPLIVWAPAVVVRPIDPPAAPDTAARIAEQIAVNGNPHLALSPTYEPGVDAHAEVAGLLVAARNQTLAPTNLTDSELELLSRSGSAAPTVVLRPTQPGTDAAKSEAMIIEHLLALGRRILVTGSSLGRLNEMTAGLSDAARSMVAVVPETDPDTNTDTNTDSDTGAPTTSLVDEAIANYGQQKTVEVATQDEADLVSDLELLIDQLAEQELQLGSVHKVEAEEHEIHDVVGTIGQITHWHTQTASKYDWLEISADASQRPCPISNGDFERWLRLMRNEVSQADLAQIAVPDPLTGLEGIPSTGEFADLIDITDDPISPSVTATLDDTIVDMDSTERRDLIAELRSYLDVGVHNDLAARVTDRVLDQNGDEFNGWTVRQGQIAAAIGRVHATHIKWSHLPVVLSMDLSDATKSAAEVLEYLGKGRPLRLNEDGTPKLGIGAPKVLKENSDFFAKVRVGGKPAVEAEQLSAFIEGAEAWRLLDEVDAAWPSSTPVPAGATVSDRLSWHDSELAKLNEILDSSKRLNRRLNELYEAGLPTGEAWTSLADVQPFLDELERVDQVYTQAEAHVEISMLASRVERLTDQPNTRNWAAPLLEAIRDRNVAGYEGALERRLSMIRWDSQMNWLGDVRSRLRPHAPKLVSAMEADPGNQAWDERAKNFHEAWRWAAVGTWLTSKTLPSREAISKRIGFVEGQLRHTVSQLTEVRTWRHALARREGLSPEQQSTDAVAPLVVASLETVENQFDLEPGGFDVVIVEGSSQVGLDSLFLQFIAPKLIVMGDGRVRGSSVTDPNPYELAELAAEMLPADYQDRWTRPELSLFDEYAVRFGDVLELAGSVVDSDENPFDLSSADVSSAGDANQPAIGLDEDSDVEGPFESLFEQRVFNRLSDEGFNVEPLFESDQYDIDLLVHGDDQSLAVEIADDSWQGPEAYAAKAKARQKLESSGWALHVIARHEAVANADAAYSDIKRRLTATNIVAGDQTEAEQDEADYALEPEIQAWAKEMASAGAPSVSAINGFGSGDGGESSFGESDDAIVSEVIVTRPLEVPDQPHLIDLTGASGSEVAIEFTDEAEVVQPGEGVELEAVEVEAFESVQEAEVVEAFESAQEAEQVPEAEDLTELEETDIENLESDVVVTVEPEASETAAQRIFAPSEEAVDLDCVEPAPSQSVFPDSVPVEPRRASSQSVFQPAAVTDDFESEPTELESGSIFASVADVVAVAPGGESVVGFNTGAFARYVEWQPTYRYAADSMSRDQLMEVITEAVAAEGPIRIDRLFRSIMKNSSSGRLNRKTESRLEEAVRAAEKGGLIAIQAPITGSDLQDFFAVCPTHTVVARRRGRRKVAEIPPSEVMAALDALDDGTEGTYRKLANKWDLGRLGFEAKRYLKACDELRRKR